MSERLLTVNGVAERLNCSRPTVFRLLASGELPSVLFSPQCRRVSESDLTEFIDARRSTRKAS